MALGAIFGGLNVLTGIGGLLGASAERRRQQEMLQQILTQASQTFDTNLERQREDAAYSLNAATGQGGDALRALGSNLGSSLARAGIYNSSAAAGALAQGQSNLQGGLISLAARNKAALDAQAADNARYLTNLRVGVTEGNLANARQDYSSAASGLGGGINALAQYFQGQMNPGGGRGVGTAVNGSQGSVLPSLPAIGTPPFNLFGGTPSINLGGGGYAGPSLFGGTPSLRLQ